MLMRQTLREACTYRCLSVRRQPQRRQFDTYIDRSTLTQKTPKPNTASLYSALHSKTVNAPPLRFGYSIFSDSHQTTMTTTAIPRAIEASAVFQPPHPTSPRLAFYSTLVSLLGKLSANTSRPLVSKWTSRCCDDLRLVRNIHR